MGWVFVCFYVFGRFGFTWMVVSMLVCCYYCLIWFCVMLFLFLRCLRVCLLLVELVVV